MKFLKIASLCVGLYLMFAFALKLTEARQPSAAPSLGSTERAGSHSAAYTYLGCVYSRSKTLDETMINLSSLSEMSEELRKARAGESEDYLDYL